MTTNGLHVLRPSQGVEWTGVLSRSLQHDFYHLPEYHAFAEHQGEGDAHLFVYAEGEFAVALPLLLRSLETVPGLERLGTGWKDATGAYAYAGPVASHAMMPASFLRGFQIAVHQVLQDLRVVSVFSRLHPLIAQAPLLAGLGESTCTSKSISIDLTLPPHSQRAAYRKNHKQDINKLRRWGITCSQVRDRGYLSEFIKVYHETMQRVHARTYFLFPPDYFERLLLMLESKIQLWGCFSEDRMICGGLFGQCDGIVQYHLGGTLHEYLKLAPMKLLIDTVRIWANEQGQRVFHLGGGSTAEPNDPLLRFKTGFSDRMHDCFTWRWVIFPEIYCSLVEQRKLWHARNSLQAASVGFFPEFRSPAAPVI